MTSLSGTMSIQFKAIWQHYRECSGQLIGGLESGDGGRYAQGDKADQHREGHPTSLAPKATRTRQLMKQAPEHHQSHLRYVIDAIRHRKSRYPVRHVAGT